MESVAKGLVNQQVILTIKTKMGLTQRAGQIVSVEGGFIKLKGPSGMETAIPIKDDWMIVTEIEIPGKIQ